MINGTSVMSGIAANIIEAQGGLKSGIRLIQKPFSACRLAAEVRSTLGEERDAISNDYAQEPHKQASRIVLLLELRPIRVV